MDSIFDAAVPAADAINDLVDNQIKLPYYFEQLKRFDVRVAVWYKATYQTDCLTRMQGILL